MADAPFRRQVVDDPAFLGLDTDAVADLVARAQREIDEGHTPSCQIAFARNGRLAYWETLGDAEPESRYLIFSATKPVVASAIWILMGEGAIDVTLPVAALIPEFAANGKEEITIEQVLLHTSGFPGAPFVPTDWNDRERRLERFTTWRTTWKPGSRFMYHPTSAHWVLAELIERCTGTDYREFVRTRVIEPLGVTGLQVGVPLDQQGDINELIATGSPTPPDELEAALGMRELPVTEVTTESLLQFNRPAWRAAGSPGAGGVATAADVALFYQGLLHDPAAIWKPEVLSDVTAHVRNSFPDFMGVPANRSLGLVIHGDDERAFMRGMGRTVSPTAFGHDGAAGQLAWADPESGVSFCYLTNGIDRHQLHEYRRSAAINNRAGVCFR